MKSLYQSADRVKPLIDLTDGGMFAAHYKAACAAILEANVPPRLLMSEGRIVFCTEGQSTGIDPRAQQRLNESGQGHIRAFSFFGYTRVMGMDEFDRYLATICEWRVPADRSEYRAILLLLYLVHEPTVFPEMIDYDKEPVDARCN